MSEQEKYNSKSYIVVFKQDRKDFFIDRSRLGISPGEWVIVQAERGRDIGKVKTAISEEYMSSHSNRRYPLEILDRASKKDIENMLRLRQKEKETLVVCKKMVQFRGLGMKLVDAEYQFDENKLTFYYTAEKRVDFRELVKDLAAHFRTRIELRQIGVRDESKKLGGLGPCGLELCCSRFLDEFKPVSTEFARDQNIVVNPSKISGLCGRLMCCLTYEEDFYSDALRKYPTVGTHIDTDKGKANVEGVSIINDTIFLRFENEDEIKRYTLKELKRILPERKEFLRKWEPKDASQEQ